MGLDVVLNSGERGDAWYAARVMPSVLAAKHSYKYVLLDLSPNAKPEDLHNAVRSVFGGDPDYWFSSTSNQHMGQEGYYTYCALFNTTVADVLLTDSTCTISVYTSDGSAADLAKKLMELIPRQTIDEKEGANKIPVAFWHWDATTGADDRLRDIECPSWEEIRQNYTEAARAELDWVMNLEKPDESGKIIIWTGPPGTGKTYAIRALAREWAERAGAIVELVLDYDHMFERADYMHSVLLEDRTAFRLQDRMVSRSARALRSIFGERQAPLKWSERGQPLRLIVIEDGASLFSTNCRNKDGFARFLNVSDGIVGQGLRTVFLLTANEHIEGIDSAVLRSGRCLQQLYFPKFSQDEARSWIGARGGNPDLARLEHSLADLYALLGGRDTGKDVADLGGAKVGF